LAHSTAHTAGLVSPPSPQAKAGVDSAKTKVPRRVGESQEMVGIQVLSAEISGAGQEQSAKPRV
jgi:hypothetical protein